MKSLKKTPYLTNINPAHFIKLSSTRGIIEFCRGNTPDYASTYNVDDNSRAALAAGKLYRLTGQKMYGTMLAWYVNFLSRHITSRFPVPHGFIKGRGITRETLSQDSLGRLLWVSAWILSAEDLSPHHNAVYPLFLFSLAHYLSCALVRPVAYALCGLSALYEAAPEDALKKNIACGAEKLCVALAKNKKNGWVWFENAMTYENARLPQALYEAYRATGKKRYLRSAEQSLLYLRKTVFWDGVFVPVGIDGWYSSGKKRAVYMQQPVEAGGMCECLVSAYRATKNKNYLREARLCLDWYHGKNTRHLPMINARDGGIYDGLGAHVVNKNQGAEAQLSYLLAACAFSEAAHG